MQKEIHEKEMQIEVFDHCIKHREEKVEELQIVKQQMESDVVDTYKELKVVEQEVKKEQEKLELISQLYIQLEKKVKRKQKEYDRTMDQLLNEEISIPFLRKEVVTEVQDKIFVKADITKKQTKNYVLSPQQYQEEGVAKLINIQK